MRLADLPQDVLQRIRSYQYDRFVEKHEGPEDWDAMFRWGDPEVLEIEGHSVLLPIDKARHPNITVLRCIESADGLSLTVFLKDTTFVPNAELERFWAGRLAVCDRVPDTVLFLALVWHEWFIVDSWVEASAKP